MATLQQIEAEIARRQQLQQVEQQIAQKQPAGQVARQPGGVFRPEPTQPERGVMDILGVGAGERETRATQELPELGEGGLLAGEDMTKVAALTPVLLTTTKPEEIGQILSANFPNIGIQEDEKGNLIAGNNKTGAQVVINKPGISKLDVLQGLGIVAAFTPSARAATLGTETAKQATKGVVARRAAQGGLAAGTTEAALQTAQAATGGEFDVEDVAMATGAGALAETVVPAIQATRQARRARQVGAAGDELESVAKNIQEAQAASQATGVPLFQAQQTAVPAQLEKQSFIGLLPAGTRKASEQLRAQNQATATAVDDFLGMIAPDEAIVRGAEKFRTASQNAVTKQVLIRKEKTSKLFDEAFKQGAEVDLKPVDDLIKAGLEDFPKGGEVAKNLIKIKTLISGKGGKKPTLRQLQNSKLEIDQMLNKFGDNSLGNTTKREITQIKNALLDQMDEASPAFKEAREAFAAASPDVTRVQESIIGKISDIDDTQLKNLSRRIFDPAETNPAVIKQAKKVINDVDPDAWNELLRVELERRMGTIKSTLAEGTTENVPGQMFNALFGNTKQRAVLFNSVDGETAKNLKYLETVLSRARLGRPGGSQTATREEIKRELKGGVTNSIRTFFSKPVTTLATTGADAGFNRRVKAMADAMFDPQWKPRMSKLRKLNPNSPDAARAMAQLLRDAEGNE